MSERLAARFYDVPLLAVRHPPLELVGLLCDPGVGSSSITVVIFRSRGPPAAVLLVFCNNLKTKAAPAVLSRTSLLHSPA